MLGGVTMGRVIGVLAVVLVLYAVVTAPVTAAATARYGGSALASAGTTLSEFVHSLAVGNSRGAVSVTSGRGTAASTYTVRRGDTLSGIATEHDTSAAVLSARNGLADPDDIRPGEHLSLR